MRLIDSKLLLEDLGEEPYIWTDTDTEIQEHSDWLRFKEMIERQPTVDAVEVVHGYWIDSTNVDHMGRIVEHGIDCSVCESVFKDDSREVVKRWKQRFKVCPFCGAKMDGERKDGE